jgi:hypothetical protein
VRYKAFDMDPYRVAEARELGLPVFFGDATRPEVLQVFMKEAKAEISGVVVALDRASDCTKAVRALRRVYPTVKEMPIFVRADSEKHRRHLAKSGATALETGPQESALLLIANRWNQLGTRPSPSPHHHPVLPVMAGALLLGGAVLSSLGMPREEVVSLIDDRRARRPHCLT